MTDNEDTALSAKVQRAMVPADLKREYENGATIAGLARKYGYSSRGPVRRALEEAGTAFRTLGESHRYRIMPRPVRDHLDADQVVADCLSGATYTAVAQVHGASRQTISAMVAEARRGRRGLIV